MDRKDYANNLLEEELSVMAGQWGTIGPRMLQAENELATLCGSEKGLLCSSGGAAYEVALRTVCKGHGSRVMMHTLCVPRDALIPSALGFEVLFCKKADKDQMDKALKKEKPDVFVCDAADTRLSLEETASVCRRNGVALILNAEGALRRKKSLTAIADFVVYDLSKDSEVDAFGAGLLCTDSQPLFETAFAVHNCGRSFGDGCTLSFDDFVGGDFRVSEWNAGAALSVLKTNHFGWVHLSAPVDMSAQPLFAKNKQV